MTTKSEAVPAVDLSALVSATTRTILDTARVTLAEVAPSPGQATQLATFQQAWCKVCNKLVHVVVDEGVSGAVFPLVGIAAGAAVGGGTKAAQGGVVGALVGAAVGVVAQQVLAPSTPVMRCPQCHHDLA
jgi:hypothetical protein